MATIDIIFKNLFERLFSEGKEYENKNRGVKRLQVPSATIRHSVTHSGFPAISMRKLNFKAVATELIWFLRGDNDIKFLNDHKVNYWNKDAYNWYVKECKEENEIPVSFDEFVKIGSGSVGRNYGVQWRYWIGGPYASTFDQIAILIQGMKEDIMSSRLKVNAWNPGELDLTALPPCHSEFQIIGIPIEGGFGFEVHWNQRSTDVLLGLPSNIASYALLGHILSEMTGFPFLGVEGTTKCVHFYDNQYDAARKLLEIPEYKHLNCTLAPLSGCEWVKVWKETGDLDFTFRAMHPDDFQLLDYTSEKSEKVEMIAPKNL